MIPVVEPGPLLVVVGSGSVVVVVVGAAVVGVSFVAVIPALDSLSAHAVTANSITVKRSRNRDRMLPPSPSLHGHRTTGDHEQ